MKIRFISCINTMIIHTLQCTGAGKRRLVIITKHMLEEVTCLLATSYSVSHSSFFSLFNHRKWWKTNSNVSAVINACDIKMGEKKIHWTMCKLDCCACIIRSMLYHCMASQKLEYQTWKLFITWILFQLFILLKPTKCIHNTHNRIVS